MVFGELPTVFPFYDDIRKQNKYRQNAEYSCPFRLITPRDALLPFQFKIPFRSNNDKSIFDKNNPQNIVVGSKMISSNGSFENNVNWQRTAFIEVESDAIIYISTRQVINELISFYDESKIFISSISNNTQRENQITTPINAKYIVVNFSKEKDTRDLDLIYFSITKTQAESVMPGNIVSWKIYTESGLEINIDNGVNKNRLHVKNYNDGIRVFYYGEKLLFTKITGSGTLLVDMNLNPGSYYSVIEFENAIYYSEIFNVPNERFRLSENNNFMRIDFWNTHDIDPIMYAPKDMNLWKQYVYLDSFVYASDPEIEIEGERDADGLIVPTFQRIVTKYRFSTVVPDYLKLALVSIQIHDNIELTTEKGIRTGKIDRMTSETAIEGDGSYSSVEIIFDQYVMTKKGCGSNMNPLRIIGQ